MSLARQYNRVFKRQLGHFATWSPITDIYEVGDFGGFRNGLFQKLGNIREFGIEPKVLHNPSAVGFSFASTGTTLVRTAAEVAVDVYPNSSVSGSLDVSFGSQYGFFIRTNELQVSELEAVDAVARELSRTRDPNGRTWNLQWRVVRKVYVASMPMVLGASERSTNFKLTGKVDALAQAELGRGSLDLQVSSNKASGLQIIGGTGPIAIDLFRVKLGGGAGLSFGLERKGDELEPEPVEVELDEDLDVDELADDDPSLFD